MHTLDNRTIVVYHSLLTNIDEQFVLLFKFAHRKRKEPFVSITNRSLVGTLITTGDVTVSIAIDVIFSAFGLPTKTTICILKNLCNTFKIGKIALGFGHCQKNTDRFTTTSFFHTVLQGWQKRVTLRKNFSSHKVALMARPIEEMS